MIPLPPAARPARAARTPEERRAEERRRARLARSVGADSFCLECRAVCTARCARFVSLPEGAAGAAFFQPER